MAERSGIPGGGGGTPIWNRRGCSSEILNLTPKGDQSRRGLSKFWPLKETAMSFNDKKA